VPRPPGHSAKAIRYYEASATALHSHRLTLFCRVMTAPPVTISLSLWFLYRAQNAIYQVRGYSKRARDGRRLAVKSFARVMFLNVFAPGSLDVFELLQRAEIGRVRLAWIDLRPCGPGNRTLGPPSASWVCQRIPGLWVKTPGFAAARAWIGEREIWYQVPATIRCVTESRGGVRKVW
jgi:hypothetical protein